MNFGLVHFIAVAIIPTADSAVCGFDNQAAIFDNATGDNPFFKAFWVADKTLLAGQCSGAQVFESVAQHLDLSFTPFP